MAEQQGSAFGEVQERLNQIVDEVSAEDISLDDALKLYEEAVKLGLSACDLSEQDIEAHLAAEEDAAASPSSEAEEQPAPRAEAGEHAVAEALETSADASALASAAEAPAV